MMIDKPATGHQAQSRSLPEYAEDLATSGMQVIAGQPGTFWSRQESGAMIRRPTFYAGPPAPDEVRDVIWRGRAMVASYLLEPDGAHPANALLYLCTDQAYALDKLASNARRDVRRGLRELAITPLTGEQVLAHGAQAFCETRRSNGLSDGTPGEFRRRFSAAARLPEIVFLGAWRDNHLAAFLSITAVDDWAEIGGFSLDALRRYTPNDALVYTALSCYLAERKYRLVSYGLSSIQAASNAEGLHRFKLKIGFEARPVHRVFVPHPLLRPLVNGLTLWGVSAALRFKPGDRRLKKAGGVLSSMLGDTRAMETVVSGKSDE